VILSACYMLWMYQRVFYGEARQRCGCASPTSTCANGAVVIPLIAMMVWMGVYSQSFLPPVSKTTARVLEQTQVNVPIEVRIEHPPRMPVEAADAR